MCVFTTPVFSHLNYCAHHLPIEQCGGEIVRMLTMQYRMNSLIMEWASSAMYQSRLVAHKSVSSHLLHHLGGVQANEDTGMRNVLLVVLR